MFLDKVAATESRYLDHTEFTLHGLLRQVEQGSADVTDARRMFHDIVDTAPTFGFTDLGEQARDAEDFAQGLYPGSECALNGVVRSLLHMTKLSRPF